MKFKFLFIVGLFVSTAVCAQQGKTLPQTIPNQKDFNGYRVILAASPQGLYSYVVLQKGAKTMLHLEKNVSSVQGGVDNPELIFRIAAWQIKQYEATRSWISITPQIVVQINNTKQKSQL